MTQTLSPTRWQDSKRRSRPIFSQTDRALTSTNVTRCIIIVTIWNHYWFWPLPRARTGSTCTTIGRRVALRSPSPWSFLCHIATGRAPTPSGCTQKSNWTARAAKLVKRVFHLARLFIHEKLAASWNLLRFLMRATSPWLCDSTTMALLAIQAGKPC